jgi:alpha-tubulin suppressor-like RCC1 family protein
MSRPVLLFLLLFGPTLQAAPNSEYPQFDFGLFHRCALTAAGAVECLGEDNHFGQFGDGRPNAGAATRPIRLIAHGARRIATGSFFTCAIIGEALQCWGDIPVPVGDGRRPTTVIAKGVREIGAGGRHACALVGDAVQCWGLNSDGQAGGDNGLLQTPRQVIAHGATAVAAGEAHSCAITDGKLFCWGRALPGRASATPPILREPTPIFDHGASAVAAGAHHTCAIVAAALWCWGDNSRGQIGIGISVDHARHSANMPPSNAAALFTDGEQRCFSSLAIEVTCWVDHPVRVLDRSVRAVYAKGDQTCALVDSALQCWGANASGQLGIDSQGDDVLRPTVAVAHGVGFAATSNARTCASIDSALQCSNGHGFDGRNNAFGISEGEARLGVWRGTLGSDKVMLCLLNPSRSDSLYYFERDGRGIGLVNPSLNREWTEQAVDSARGTWTFAAAVGERLVGTWTAGDDSHTLPIHLSRLAAPEREGANCMNASAFGVAFNQPRLDAVQLATETQDIDTQHISAFDGAIRFIELLNDNKQAIAFNQAMRRRLTDQLLEYFSCAMSPNPMYTNALEVELRVGRWLILRESYESYCGGAHPNSGIAGYQTWNLATGALVEPWTWIANSKTQCTGYPCGYHAPDDLNKILLARATRNKADDECVESVNNNIAYLLRPSSTGLVFSTDFAHVIQACNEDIELAYADLVPFLTEAGQQAVQSITRAAKRLPEK